MNFDYQLFLGFSLSTLYLEKLNQLPAEIYSLFIQNHPDYLQMVHYQDKVYLGKQLGQLVDSSVIELSSLHILSLLKRLDDTYPYEDQVLTLIPVNA